MASASIGHSIEWPPLRLRVRVLSFPVSIWPRAHFFLRTCSLHLFRLLLVSSCWLPATPSADDFIMSSIEDETWAANNNTKTAAYPSALIAAVSQPKVLLEDIAVGDGAKETAEDSDTDQREEEDEEANRQKMPPPPPPPQATPDASPARTTGAMPSPLATRGIRDRLLRPPLDNPSPLATREMRDKYARRPLHEKKVSPAAADFGFPALKRYNTSSPKELLEEMALPPAGLSSIESPSSQPPPTLEVSANLAKPELNAHC